ncbi:MAG: threonine/serine exporter family protein [Candidatus Baltobacteraceae bacterium]
MISTALDEPSAPLTLPAEFVVLLGEVLHRSGLSTDDIERTLSQAARFLGLPLEVFALPTMLLFAIGPPDAQRVVMRRVQPGSVNLRRLAVLDALYDRLQSGQTDLAAAIERLRSFEADVPAPGIGITIISNALVAFGVAVILGGGLNELIVATAIGVVTGTLALVTRRVIAVAQLFEVAAAFFGTLIVALFARFIGPVNLYISVVAGVVILLPGYSLTLAIHELANRNVIAGTSRLGQVFMTLIALSCGALLGFALVGPKFLAQVAIQPHPVGATLWVAAVVLASLGLSLALDARPRDMWVVFAASLVAIGSSHVFGVLPIHAIATFAAAFVCGMVANLGARLLRLPQPVFLVPALMMLVPGSLSYESVLFIFSKQNVANAAQLGINAVAAAVFIVAGLFLSQLLVPATTLRRHRPGQVV